MLAGTERRRKQHYLGSVGPQPVTVLTVSCIVDAMVEAQSVGGFTDGQGVQKSNGVLSLGCPSADSTGSHS